jgi:hypothetical protein
MFSNGLLDKARAGRHFPVGGVCEAQMIGKYMATIRLMHTFSRIAGKGSAGIQWVIS